MSADRHGRFSLIWNQQNLHVLNLRDLRERMGIRFYFVHWG